MRRIATGDSEADNSAVKSTPRKERGSDSWLKVHWCLASLVIIMALALVLRVVFAYGISAGDDYALSGGTSASSHLRIIIELLAGTYDPASQPQLNYPYGIESVSGPLYDYIMAGIAYLVTLCGVSDSTAAAGVMAWSSPILGVLTAIPVFMVARKIFDDDVVAVVSAFIYEFTALVIMVTPFSYGSEFALLGFLSAFMVYFLVSAIKVSDEKNLSGFLCVLTRDVFFYAILAGIFYGLVIHTWTDFRVIAIVAAVIVALSLFVARIKGKDMGAIVGISTIFLIFGTFIGAAYYLPFGLWDDVFSGGCLIGLFTVLYSVVFLLLSKKPWIITIPLMIIVIVAVGAVLEIALPDIADAIFKGNSAFEAGLVSELADSFSRSSISAMATWFGWITVWMSFALGVYMLLRYRKDGGKRLYGFVMLWMLSMFFIGWFKSGYAYFAAVAMAIGAAYVIVTIVRKVDVRSYFAGFKTLRGSGIKGAAKKVFSFFPFITVVVIAVLVVVPNTVYAFDAATPTNDEKADYYGGLGYTINTSDSSEISSAWNSYSDVDKDGALLTWYGYTDAAAVFGGFSTVTSSYGDGSAAMSTALLADGSAGALVSMSVRLLGASPEKVSSAVSASGLGIDADTLYAIVTDDSKCEEIIADTDFAELNLDDALLPYYAAYTYLVDDLGLSTTQLCALYDSVCSKTGDKISYIEVDTSMLPIAYNDSSSFSTIAYLGGYEVSSTGGVSPFYEINSYSGYAFYSDAMYSTFIYQALIGATPSEAGQDNSLAYLSGLSTSTGTVKPVPANGLTGFAVDYWHVMYNADAEATGSDDGWEDMDAAEAIAKQNSEGGIINYLSSVMVLKYVGVSEAVSGTITLTNGDKLAGATVNVYRQSDIDSTGVIDYVLYSSSVSDGNGYYTAAIPTDAEYKVVVSTSAGKNADGNVFYTFYSTGTDPYGIPSVNAATVSGAITSGTDTSTVVYATGKMVMAMQNSDVKYEVSVTNGVIDTAVDYPTGILPGTYDITVYTTGGATVGTSTLTVMPGSNTEIAVTLTVYTVTATVTDQETGQPVPSGTAVTVYDTANSVYYGGVTDDEGVAEIYVPSGSYSVYMDGASGYMTTSPTSVAVSSSAQSVSLTAYVSDYVDFEIAGAVPAQAVSVQSYAFSTTAGFVTDSGVTYCRAYLPVNVGIQSTYYASVTINGTTYTAACTPADTTVSLTAQDAVTVSGTVTFDDDAVSGATVILDSSSWLARTTTDSDGKFSLTVPYLDGDYVLYAFNGVNYSIENISGTAGVSDKAIALTEGDTFTYSMNYYTGMSPSSRTICYADLFTAVLTDNEKSVSWTLYHLMTGSDGKVTMAVPSDFTVNMTVKTVTTAYMFIGDKDGDTAIDFTTSLTDDGSMYVPREAPGSRSSSYGWSYVVKVTGVNVVADDYLAEASEFDGTITNTSNRSISYTVTDGAVSGDVVPGNYTFLTDDGTKYYYNGTVSVFAGKSGQYAVFASEPFVATKVVLTVGDDDTVTVEASDDEALTDYDEDTHTYHLQKDGLTTYVIKAVDSDGNVAYCYVAADGTTTSTDLTTKAATVTVTGSAGVPADGYLYAQYDSSVTLRFDITDGSYSAELPVGKTYTLGADIDADFDGYTYGYLSDSCELTIAGDATEDIVYNLQAVTKSCTVTENDYVEFVSSTINGDRVEALTVELTYVGDATGMTYIITGLSGLKLDQTYTQYVAEGASNSVQITVAGTYNSKVYGAGASEIGISVQNAAGTELATLSIPAEEFDTVVADKVTLTKANADDGVADAVNGYSYRYALNVENESSGAVYVKVDAALAASAEGWSVFVADTDSYKVLTAADALSDGFLLNGKSSATYYVVAFSQADYSASDVPDVTYTVTAQAAADLSAIAVEGDESSGTMVHATVEVEQTGGSATDGGASDEGKKLTTLFYGLLVVLVLLILLFFWAASKRGVFSRN